MPGGNTHRLIATLAVGGTSFVSEACKGEVSGKFLVDAILARVTTSLPDLIEPARNPHHRQFFHSVAFGSLILAAGVKLYKWEAKEDWERALRKILFIGCCGYLLHLLSDSFTPRGLPFLGKA